MKSFRSHLDLQAKITLILVAVIVPTFLIVTILENKFTLPILEGEIRQIGIHSGKTLAAEIVSGRLLSRPNPTQVIENSIQEMLYTQPDIVRIDVVSKDLATGALNLVATNIEEDPGSPPPIFQQVDMVTSEFHSDENGSGSWEINVPIELRGRDPRGPKKILGLVHVVVSTKLVSRLISTLWKTTATAAAFSVVILLLILSYLMRKTISNDRLLRKAESENSKLIEQLHEAQRQLMTTEKLAVMGQLTASFAHEIGTPLNAVGGHLQLLQEEVPLEARNQTGPRLEVIQGQLKKIEEIVKGFLQSTAKPTSQRQLVDLNHLIEKTVGIVKPQADSMGVVVKKKLNREMGPLRVVPLDIEQIFLNLINNSLDGLQSKASENGRTRLEITSDSVGSQGKKWALVSVYDTGQGIRRADLRNVLKPFFTTKRPGEGTGLGLTICQQLTHKYGGELLIDSKEGVWTRVTLRIPYHSNT